MRTKLQLTANANNAALSTGPRTAAGKARAANNALRHGLRAEATVLPGEKAEEWQAHCDGIVQSLAPAGALEAALAERVALSLWRLRRVAAYEVAVTALGMEGEATPPPAEGPGPRPDGLAVLTARLAQAEQQLQLVRAGLESGGARLLAALPRLPAETPASGQDVCNALLQIRDTLWDHYNASQLPMLEDRGWLTGLGVPEGRLGDAYQWDGWTVGMARTAWRQLAAAAQVDADELLVQASADWREEDAASRPRVRALEKTVRDLRRRVEERERHERQAKMLPDELTLNNAMRYEAHLSRQMLQALHTLERLQAARVGLAVAPPAALDVTVDAPDGEAGVPAGEGVKSTRRPTGAA